MEQRNPPIRLETERERGRYQRLARFCSESGRDVPATVRRIIDLFFADGENIANMRLTSRAWDAPSIPHAAEAAVRAKRRRRKRDAS